MDSSSSTRNLNFDNNKVLFEVNTCLDSADTELLELFIENKKLSGGGDLLKVEYADTKRSLSVTFEENDAKQRILAKKYFFFQNYLLRASELGYRNDKYELNESEILLVNITTSGDEEENLVVRMYAEYLLPDNDVINIDTSKIYAHTYIVKFNTAYDKQELMRRYKKKSQLRNKQIKLLESFETNAVLIKPRSTGINFNSNELGKRLLDEMKTRDCFMCEDKNWLLCQFGNKTELDAFLNAIEGRLNESGLVAEYCRNFDLLSDDDECIHDVTPIYSTATKSTQTDKELLLGLIREFNQFEKNGLDSKSSVKITETNNKNKFKLDQVLKLDSNHFYTIALINSKQIFINFEDVLSKLNRHLKMTIVEDGAKSKSLLIKNTDKNENDKCWKDKVLAEINKYFSSKAAYKTVKIPDEILKNSNMLGLLSNELAEFNRSCSAFYFRIDGGQVHCYGTKNALLKKVESLPNLFKTISNEKNQSGKSFTHSSLNSLNHSPNNGLTNSVEIDPKSLLGLCLLHCRQIYNDFKNFVKTEHKSELNEINSNKGKKFTINYPIQLKSQDESAEWVKKVNYLIKYFEENKLKQKKIYIPANLQRAKELTDLKKHIDAFFNSLGNIFVELNGTDCVTGTGYAESIKFFAENIYSKFKNLENNIKFRIKKNLDIKLTFGKKFPMLDVLLKKNGAYLNDFKEKLAKLEAILEIERPPNELGARIKCTMNQAKQENEQTVEKYRARIDSFINNYFSSMSSRVIQLPFKQGDFDLETLFLGEPIKFNWIDSSTIKLNGLKDRIDAIMPKLLNISTETNEQLLIHTSPSEEILEKAKVDETFLISDLKWFQTRMLFEKKYFLYVTETYKDMSVLVDTQLSRIFFTGKKKDIEEAKKLAFDILDQILGTEVDSTPNILQKITNNETMLANLIKSKGICCIVDSKSNTNKYTIYGTTYEEIEKCRFILSENGF